MAKRLTDSEKWDDPWFLDLTSQEKLIWLFILDKCDYAGIWKVNKRLLEFCLNEKVDLEKFLEESKGRIQVLNSEKWHIPKFLEFQYKNLTEKNKIYSSVEACLMKEGLNMPLASPLKGGKRKDKDKEKEKEMVKDKEKEDTEKKPFGEDGLVMLTVAQFEKLVARLGEKRTHEYIHRLENYTGSKGKRYKSHYHTILTWFGNDNGSQKPESRQEKLKKQLEEIDYDAG